MSVFICHVQTQTICFFLSSPDNIVFLSDKERMWRTFFLVSAQQANFFFVFSCLFKSNIEDSECHQVKELTYTGEKGDALCCDTWRVCVWRLLQTSRHQEKPIEPQSVIQIHSLVLILLLVNNQYKETVCIFFFVFACCPSFTRENNVRWKKVKHVFTGHWSCCSVKSKSCWSSKTKIIIVFLYSVS